MLDLGTLTLTHAARLDGPDPLLGPCEALEIRLLGLAALYYLYLGLVYTAVIWVSIQDMVGLFPLELALETENVLF